MRFPLVLVVFALLAAPAPAADDLTPLYPENAVAVLTIDIARITKSPLGKKMIGADKPFTAARKLVKVLLPEDALVPREAVQTHLAELANKLERVTVVVTLEPGGGFGPKIAFVAFLEGANTEDDYVKGLEGLAKADGDKLEVEKRGGRKLLAMSYLHGASANKSLFVVAAKAELVTDVLDRFDGKKKPVENKPLKDAVKRVKPEDTPVWFVGALVGADKNVSVAVATLSLKDDADFLIEFKSDDKEGLAGVGKELKEFFDRMAKGEERHERVWAAAKAVVKQDGKTLTVTGKFPGKLLAEEYAKQK